MKINELRVGSLVYGKTQFGQLIAKVTHLTAVLCGIEPIDAKIANGEGFACKMDGDEFKLIEPIPLTKEFFEKNGFIKQNDWEEVLYYRSEDMRIDVYENYLGWVVNIDNEAFTMVFSNNLKYVHELQNAYYISTGEEIKIKL